MYTKRMGKKGQAMGMGSAIISLFIVLMIVGILQLVSVLTTSKVAANIDQSSFTLAENQTVATMKTTNLEALELGSTAQTVLAAGVIIASVVGFILFVRGR